VIRVADRDDLARLEQIEKEADALLIDYLHAEVWPAIASLHERMGHVGYVLALVEQENADAIGFAHVL
jgi:hypothetical protein